MLVRNNLKVTLKSSWPTVCINTWFDLIDEQTFTSDSLQYVQVKYQNQIESNKKTQTKYIWKTKQTP